jgi:malonyl-CoA O-methyltransferase
MSQSLSSDNSHLSAPIHVPLVKRLFAEPARVAESDFLRREVSARMFERLQLVKITPEIVLDAGCGEGADMPVLKKRFHDAQILGIDGASAMVSLARERQLAALSSVSRLINNVNKWRSTTTTPGLVCGDFAQTPFAGQCIDVVWSNLALHWHPQPDRVFAEWARIVKVEGLLMFSCFGPDTFKELRSAFETIDLAPHTLPFVDMHDFGDMLVHAGFTTPVMDMEIITVTYDTPQRLLEDVRSWGGNPLQTRRRGLLGKAAYAEVLRALEAMRRPQDGKIPLTFEVVYGHAFKPQPRMTKNGEAIIRLDFPKK